MTSRHFFEAAARTWDSRPPSAKTKRAIETALHALGLCEGDVVLDIGCGTGISIPELADAVGATGTVLGLDFSYPMLAQARVKELGSNAVYIRGDAHVLPIRSDSVDAALCFAAFAHFGSKEVFLEELYRVLQPGGRGVICHAMSSAELNQFHKNVGDQVKSDVLPEVEQVAAMGQAAGFAVDETIEKSGLYMVAFRKPAETNSRFSGR
jgi:ubiquinone/menaquinone biosynthesis C-methylase UbiE